MAPVFFLGAPAYAQAIPGYPTDMMKYDSREIAMLPNWCIYTHGFDLNVPGGNDPRQREYWSSLMGKTKEGRPMWGALHHYCFGLMRINRAKLLTRNRSIRTYYLLGAINEFDFVLHYAPMDFVLMPELLTKKGETLLSLGRVRQGIQELERAIEVKPDYWPPYATISDHYKSTGDLNMARELLEKGLSSAPDSKALQTRLRELDAVKDKRK